MAQHTHKKRIRTDVRGYRGTPVGILNQWTALCNTAGQAIRNAAPFLPNDLSRRALKQMQKGNLEAYPDGFSPSVQEISERFKFRKQIAAMVNAATFGSVIKKFALPNINLSPLPVQRDVTKTCIRLAAPDTLAMGIVFEELIRKFNEENNEKIGEHRTPRIIVEQKADRMRVPIHDHIIPLRLLRQLQLAGCKAVHKTLLLD